MIFRIVFEQSRIVLRFGFDPEIDFSGLFSI